ncbi:hypothetical protein ACM66B_000939 [Microbotryomycetes sp. NB124-2]
MSPTSGGNTRQQISKAIAALDESTAALLRSAVVIPSVPTALLELVRNAIDAGATRVDCTINLDRWTIKCDDNGRGIDAHELDKVARGGADVLDRGWTSKHDQDTTTFGFRGEALASLAGLGVLEIVTRTRDARESLGLLVRAGERLHQGTSSVHKSSYGTTVWVRDMYSQFPVRRRPYRTRSTQQTLLTACRQSLEALALIHPAVNFSLSDSSVTSASGESQPKRLLQLAGSSAGILGRWKQLWGRNGIEDVRMFDIAEATTDTIRAEGFFSMAASQTKQFQHVYVNSNPIEPCALHKAINAVFAQSSFASHAIALLSTSRHSRGGRKSPKKATDRYPIFVLDLRVPATAVDVTLEPEKRSVQFKDEDAVLNFVRSLADAFLNEQGFKSAPARQTMDTSTPPEMQVEDFRPHKRPKHGPDRPATITVDPNEPESATTKWRNPLTGAEALVDSRTGHSRHTRVFQKQASDRKDLIDTTNLRRDQPAPDDAAPAPSWLQNTLSTWVNPVFAVSKPFISSIKSTKAGVATGEPLHQRELRSGHTVNNVTAATQAKISSFFNSRAQAVDALLEDAEGFGQAFDSAALACCEFISQVDRKFLLVKIRSRTREGREDASSMSLALIDQHAASERVRVERYFEELCDAFEQGRAVRSTRLEPKSSMDHSQSGKAVVVSSLEATQLIAADEFLTRWGIKVRVPFEFTNRSGQDEQVVTDYVQVFVEEVPSIVAERLSNDSRLLQDFVRSLATDEVSTASVKRTESVPWHAVLRQCPLMLVELVNSKACRGAIMFNDELSHDQSLRLISQLARTRFPFQCAHGRPSLAPIINLPPLATADALQTHNSGVQWDLWAK